MVGRLVCYWAEQARSLITDNVVPKGLIIDITDVTYVDPRGEQLLNFSRGMGAEFVARSIYALAVCERLGLPLDGKLQDSSDEYV
jgi:hypothetical protein